MGASYPDIDRCNYFYAPGDRRCRNPLEFSGAAFCYYHRDKGDRAQARAARMASGPPRRAGQEALRKWMMQHPLDSATNVLRAQNQLLILFAAGAISNKELHGFRIVLRDMSRSIPAVHNEFSYPARVSHQRQGQEFLDEVRDTLEQAIAADRAKPAAQPPPSDPAPEDIESSPSAESMGNGELISPEVSHPVPPPAPQNPPPESTPNGELTSPDVSHSAPPSAPQDPPPASDEDVLRAHQQYLAQAARQQAQDAWDAATRALAAESRAQSRAQSG